METTYCAQNKPGTAGDRLSRIIFPFLILLFPMSALQAQRNVEKNASLDAGQAVNLEFKFADKIDIRIWEKSEALVKATVDINDNQDNEAFDLMVSENSSAVTFKSEIKDMDKLQRVIRKTVTKEDGTTKTYEYCSVDMDLFFEVFLPSGVPLSINTISGDIELEEYKGELVIKTISGFIDLTLGSKEKATLKMSTISGEIYSNLDLEFGGEKPNLPRIGGTKINAMQNGGGTRMELETISGDIFLRKTD